MLKFCWRLWLDAPGHLGNLQFYPLVGEGIYF